MHGCFFSQTLFVPLAWVLTGRQNKPRWNWVCKQACEYRHETHKLAPRPDEYASAGIVASMLFTIPTYGQRSGKQTGEPSRDCTFDRWRSNCKNKLKNNKTRLKLWSYIWLHLTTVYPTLVTEVKEYMKHKAANHLWIRGPTSLKGKQKQVRICQENNRCSDGRYGRLMERYWGKRFGIETKGWMK